MLFSSLMVHSRGGFYHRFSGEVVNDEVVISFTRQSCSGDYTADYKVEFKHGKLRVISVKRSDHASIETIKCLKCLSNKVESAVLYCYRCFD